MEEQIPTSARIFRGIATTFAVLTVVLAAFIGYVAYSRAVVIVRLAPVEQVVPFRLTLAETPSSASLAGTETLGGKFAETTITVSDTFTATGSGATSDDKLGGLITLVNTTSKDQKLIATTRVVSKPGDIYRIQEAVTVPANGAVTAVVKADATTATNVSAAEKLTIPGLSANLQTVIYGQAIQPLTMGGAGVRTITAEDLIKARQSLRDKAAMQAAASFSTTFGRQPAVNDLSSDTTSETISAKVGDAVQSFTIKSTYRIIAAFVDKAVLLQQLATDNQGATIDPTTLTYQLGKVDLVQRIASLTGEVKTSNNVDQQSAVFQPQNMIGLSIAELQKTLQAVPGVASVEVKLSPYWQTKLPQIANRITVNFEASN